MDRLEFGIVAGFAVGCGVTVWLMGRGLRRQPDHPVIAERVNSHRVRNGLLVMLFSALSVATLYALGGSLHVPSANGLALPPALLLAFLVNWVAAVVGDFPTREVVFEETCGFTAYLGHLARIAVAVSGFWLLLMLAPYLVCLSGPKWWLVAPLLFGLLTIWSVHFHRLTPILLGSEIVDDPELLRRFEFVDERSDVDSPHLYRCGPERGVDSNAIALPGIRDSAVTFTKSLLTRLTPEEATGVYAHEVAHLEQFDRRVLRKLEAWQFGLIAAACFGAPLLGFYSDRALAWLLWSWLPIVLAYVHFRGRSRQRLEVDGDRRAVELCGAGEPLVRALSKIHAANHLPRRLAIEAERGASHPSLARRIQAIRAVASERAGDADQAESKETENESVASMNHAEARWVKVFASSADPREHAALDDHGLYLLTLPEDDQEADSTDNEDAASFQRLRDRAAKEQSFAYCKLVELRMTPKRNGFSLHIVDRCGTKILFPLLPEDEGRVHETLDRVDVWLAPSSALRTAPGSVRLACLTVMFSAPLLVFGSEVIGIGEALWLLQLGAFPYALPTRARTVAYGAMGLSVALGPIRLTDDTSWWSGVPGRYGARGRLARMERSRLGRRGKRTVRMADRPSDVGGAGDVAHRGVAVATLLADASKRRILVAPAADGSTFEVSVSATDRRRRGAGDRSQAALQIRRRRATDARTGAGHPWLVLLSGPRRARSVVCACPGIRHRGSALCADQGSPDRRESLGARTLARRQAVLHLDGGRARERRRNRIGRVSGCRFRRRRDDDRRDRRRVHRRRPNLGVGGDRGRPRIAFARCGKSGRRRLAPRVSRNGSGGHRTDGRW